VRAVTSRATQSDGPTSGAAVVGRRLGDRYELERAIASGGMAQVWCALDHVLDRRVAVKILHPHLASDEAFLRRFRLEALAAARLRHPSIVAIYDTVSEAGVEAIVMELAEGPTLRQLLDERGRLAVVDVVDLGGQVAEALDAAHRGGVVHRDIKPSNILLAAGGRVLVTDFGIAKAGEGGDLTVTGTLLGTAKYLSPEQVTGDPVDPRSDLYALGVVMFEALCGRPPFQADTDAATALARLHQDPPSLRSFRPEVPRGLEDLVLRALAREPDDRWSRATELRAALSSIRVEEADDHDSPTIVTARPALPHSVDPTEVDEPSFIRSERSWLVPAFLVLVAAAALGISGALFSQTSVGRELVDRGLGRQPTPDTVFTTPTVPVDVDDPGPLDHGLVVDASAFDPFGDGAERDAEVPNVLDDDLATFWPTETYENPDVAGSGLKPGVGLILRLDGVQDVDRLEVRTLTEGWAAQIYLAEGFGADRGEWGPVVAEGRELGQQVSFDLGGRSGSEVLLWITHVGRSTGSDGVTVNRLQVTDVKVS
jgi:eukaryotic-like serine/threonine-protein kinase